jgi:hypothetical protein
MSRIGLLLELSREHHTSLVMARDARRTSKSDDPAILSAAVRSIEAHWHTMLAEHFEREERLIQTIVDELDSEAVARINAEHAELRFLALGPCTLEPAARLQRFGDLLGAHVRYEERIFFPQLQSHSRFASANATADSDAP